MIKRSWIVLWIAVLVCCGIACSHWVTPPQHYGSEQGDSCHVDKDCDSQWCVNGRCDRRDP
ncbi:MAG: hypothetical protein QM831_10915 [Kofleriaceae bacterium]